ncbi:hypothetical protein H311_03945 [Anncaliia algerae PRA109]|nr:hypothetical protein H311_03945 [Anncaliia algerae PRA109]
MKLEILLNEVENLKKVLSNALEVIEVKTCVILKVNHSNSILMLKIFKSNLRIVPSVQTIFEPRLESKLLEDLNNGVKNIKEFSLYPLVLIFFNFIKQNGVMSPITQDDFIKWNKENKLEKKILKGKSGKEFFLQNGEGVTE